MEDHACTIILALSIESDSEKACLKVMPTKMLLKRGLAGAGGTRVRSDPVLFTRVSEYLEAPEKRAKHKATKITEVRSSVDCKQRFKVITLLRRRSGSRYNGDGSYRDGRGRET